jgi:hypothetical protein
VSAMAYLYEHWRPDTNVCFYVGKGSGNRAHLFGIARSDRHRRIVEKLRRNGMRVEVRIISDGLSDEDALKLEQERIAFYGREKLINHTAGGDGLLNPSDETRRKMSSARQKTLSDPEFIARHAAGVRAANERDPLRAKRAGLRRRGKQAAPGVGEKISAALKGRKRDEHISDRMKGERNPFFGKRHSKEILDRIAQKNRGKKLSPEVREKMKVSQGARRNREALTRPPKVARPSKFPKLPFKHSSETIEKMRVAAKKRGVSPVTRAAQKAALTGRKRAPFKHSTIVKMRAAAKLREENKRIVVTRDT